MGTELELAIMRPEAKEMQAIFTNNLAGGTISRFDLGVIKIPGGGETKWIINDVDGSKVVDSFEGIIVKAHNTRAYWKSEVDKETGKKKDSIGGPPNCSSDDGLTGSGIPGGLCGACKLKDFPKPGSEEKASPCKLIKTLFILLPGEFLPVVINCPPTSYQLVHKYFTSLSRKLIRYQHVITSFSLKGDSSDDGFKFARVTPSMSRLLVPEEIEVVDKFINTFADSIQQKVDTSEYNE